MCNLAKQDPSFRLAIELDKQARYLLWQVANNKIQRDQMLGQLLNHPRSEQLSARVTELEQAALVQQADELIGLAAAHQISRSRIQQAIDATPLEHQNFFRGALNEKLKMAQAKQI